MPSETVTETVVFVRGYGPVQLPQPVQLEVAGNTGMYYSLPVVSGRKLIPVSKISSWVRPLSDSTELKKELLILTKNRSRPQQKPAHLWIKEKREQLASGELKKILYCVRDLYTSPGHEWSFAYMEIYDTALEQLAAEVSWALGLSLQGTRGLLETALENRTLPAELR